MTLPKLHGLMKCIAIIQCTSLSCCAIPILDNKKYDIYSFGKDNLECLQWSDWNKLCWRTNKSSDILCTSEKKYITNSSKPFCTISKDKSLLHENIESRNRFCDKKNINGECEEYKPERPFNGLSPESMEEWCLYTNFTSNNKNKRKEYRGNLIFCTKWKKDIPCNLPIGGTYAPMVNVEGIIINRSPSPQSRPVWGIYCLG